MSPFGLFSPRLFFSFFLFSFFCCGFILPCCNCFNYSFIFPNVFFIFLILFCFLFFGIVLLLFSFLPLFIYLFLLRHKACGISVPKPEVGPELLWWELWVQTAGLTENLRTQGISIEVRSTRGPHLSTRTQLYPTACKLQCWRSQARQPVRQEYNSIHQKKKKK